MRFGTLFPCLLLKFHIEYMSMKRDTSPKTLIYLIPNAEIQWQNTSAYRIAYKMEKTHKTQKSFQLCENQCFASIYSIYCTVYMLVFYDSATLLSSFINDNKEVSFLLRRHKMPANIGHICHFILKHKQPAEKSRLHFLALVCKEVAEPEMMINSLL